MKTLPNLSNEEFLKLIKIAPLSVVECVIKNDQGEILLTKRGIEPFKGKWHLVGGFIAYNEKLEEAVKRVIKKELGNNIEIKEIKFLGYYDYINCDPRGHIIAHYFQVKISGIPQKNEETLDVNFFKKLPEDIIFFQKDALQKFTTS